MKKLVLLIAVLLIAVVNITGCASPGDGRQKSAQVSTELPVKKTLYDDNTGIPIKEEPVKYRIVYDRYIYPVYHLDGWDIRDLCKKTHTEMNVLEGNETPKKFELARGKVRLTFVGEGDDRTMTYKVFKDGKELKMDYGPHKYRGMGPFIELNTFLNSLEIRHYTDESTKLVYIDSDNVTEILGEEMYSGEISLAPGESYEAKVDYDYEKANDPEYKRIRFSLNGKNSFDMTLFDHTNPGSSKSYRDAEVNQVEYEGNCFIQIVLNAQGRSNGDTVVLKYADGKLEPVFTNEDYKGYVSTNLMLETDSNGRCTFIDKINGIKKGVEYKGLMPNSIFSVRQLWFNFLKYRKTDNRLVMTATANSVYNGSPFFEISFEFQYNGTAFIPVKAEALDREKFIEDKKNGKSIEPLSKYKLFEYDISDVDTNLYTFVNPNDIEWITKKGGLPSNKNWIVLYPEKDSDKVKKIASLVNTSSNYRKSTEDDLQFLHTKHGYPVDIVIRMKDGSEFSLKSAMKLTTRKVDNGTETTGTTYKDRFILSYNKNDNMEYYTVFSNEAAEYLINASNSDFPRVDKFSITPEKFKLGDKVVIAGDGCTENEVNICLTNGNDADKEEYIIGKVKPVFGEWKWEGIVDRDIKTYDGKDISFKHNKFMIGIQVGGSRRICGNEINFN